MTTEAVIRVLIDLVADVGQDPLCAMDTDHTNHGEKLVLREFETEEARSITVGPAAADQAFTLDEAVTALLILSDEVVSLRLDSGETLMGNGRLWVFVAADQSESLLGAGDILFTGNGSTTATVRIWQVFGPALLPPPPPP